MLDGWRGLAILFVLYSQFVGAGEYPIGRLGVELFFVLSGRLMAEILFVRRLDLPEFFKRRFARIGPALAVLVVFVTVAFWSTGLHVPLHLSLASLTATANYAAAFGLRAPVLEHVWSLCVEAHAYLLLGALAFWARRRPVSPRAVAALFALVCVLDGAISTALGGEHASVYWRSDVRAGSIMIGVAAWLWFRDRTWPAASPILYAAAAALLNLPAVPDPVKYSLGTVCLAMCLTSLSTAPAWLRTALSVRPLTVCGLCSYSLYLWQQPFYQLIDDEAWPALLLAGAVLCGLASYYLVEQPARAFINALKSVQGLPRPVRSAESVLPEPRPFLRSLGPTA
jgi:peptidoglycan/LPS O-acetylase OafA/YrhL